MKIPSFAKINLGLEVLRRRPDGYHDIRTLFQWVDFHDTIEFRPLPGPEIRLSGDDPSIPWDETNLIYRAAAPPSGKKRSRAGRGDRRRPRRIPAGGGLGGGSSNAAMTLLGLNRLWGLGLSPGDLARPGPDPGDGRPLFFHRRALSRGGPGRSPDSASRSSAQMDRPGLPPFPVPTPLIYRSLEPAALTSEDKDSKITRFLEDPGTRFLDERARRDDFSLLPSA